MTVPNDLIERCPGLVGVHDLDGQVHYMNLAAARALGYEPGEMVGRNMTEFLAPSLRPLFPLAMERLRTAGHAEGVMTMLTRAGTERTWWYRHVICEEPGSAPFVLADSVDVSDLQLTDSALQESEDRFRYLAEHIHQVFWIRDPFSNQILYLSPAYETVWGRSRQEILQQPYIFLHTIHPDDRDLVLNNFALIMGGQTTQMEYRIVRPDGSQRWIASHSFPVRDEDGNVARVVAITEDITERKQADVELRRAKEAAEAATHAKSQLLAHVSHEVRTPLTIVMGMSEILRATALNPEQSDLLDRIEVATRHLHTLANDLLDYSKIEAGRLELGSLEFRMADVLRDATEPFQPQAASRGVSLECRIAADVPTLLRGDPGRLRQVIANLVGNATKFTEHGGIVVAVDAVSPTQPANGNVEIGVAVSDTGPGIAPHEINKIFEPFSQAHAAAKRNHGGVGLGLAICRQLVELLGGHISVESQLGTGSTFRFTARLQTAAAPAAHR